MKLSRWKGGSEQSLNCYSSKRERAVQSEALDSQEVTSPRSTEEADNATSQAAHNVSKIGGAPAPLRDSLGSHRLASGEFVSPEE